MYILIKSREHMCMCLKIYSVWLKRVTCDVVVPRRRDELIVLVARQQCNALAHVIENTTLKIHYDLCLAVTNSTDNIKKNRNQ